MGLGIYFGRNLEELSGKLIGNLQQKPLPDVMAKEIIVVQEQGLAAYLRQIFTEDKDLEGICANVEAVFPNKFFLDVLWKFLPSDMRGQFCEDRELFSRDVLPWRILKIFHSHDKDDEYDEVKKYANGDEQKLHQLAEHLASCFDKYQIHRGEDLRSWNRENFQPTCWQQKLYRELCANGHRGMEFYIGSALKGEVTPPKGTLPARVSFFAIDNYAPIQLQLIKKLSEHIEVNIYFVNPASGYWSDLVKTRREGKRNPEDYDAFFAQSNPLLAELGVVARNSLQLLVEISDGSLEDVGDDSEITAQNLLENVQSDIYRVRNDDDNTAIKWENTPDNDRSLRIFNCHSPRREVEILHDQILNAIESTKNLAENKRILPQDVLVMAPDINTYSPIIDAVFCNGPLKNVYIINNRTIGAENRIGNALLKLFQLVGSRFNATEVYDFISLPPVATKYDFTPDDLANFMKLIQSSDIHWGVDSATREKFCKVGYKEFSWLEGLDRLLMDKIVEESDNCQFEVMPANSSAVDAEKLGVFCELAREVLNFARDCETPKTMAEWKDKITAALDRFFPCDNSDYIDEVMYLTQKIDALANNAATTEYVETLPISVIIDKLKGCLGMPAPGHKVFLRGKITFCPLGPMRGVPMKMIAVLGLNHSKFPRHDREEGIDILIGYKRGDHSSQLEDKYLFLQALLAAKERLLLSYCGQSTTGKAELPPATPLMELIAFLQRNCPEFEVTKQLSSPFNERYFSGDKNLDFVSYNQAACNVAKELRNHNIQNTLWHYFEGKETNAEIPESVNWTDFANTLCYPCETFCKANYGTKFKDQSITLSDDESDIGLEYSEKDEINDLVIKLNEGIKKKESEDNSEKKIHEYFDKEIYPEYCRRRLLPTGQEGKNLLTGQVDEINGAINNSNPNYFLNVNKVEFEISLERCGDKLLKVDLSIDKETPLYNSGNSNNSNVTKTVIRTTAYYFDDEDSKDENGEPIRTYFFYVKYDIYDGLSFDVFRLLCFIAGFKGNICYINRDKKLEEKNHRVLPECNDEKRKEAIQILNKLVTIWRDAYRKPLPIFEKATYGENENDFNEDINHQDGKRKKVITFCFGENPFADGNFSDEFKKYADILTILNWEEKIWGKLSNKEDGEKC